MLIALNVGTATERGSLALTWALAELFAMTGSIWFPLTTTTFSMAPA